MKTIVEKIIPCNEIEISHLPVRPIIGALTHNSKIWLQPLDFNNWLYKAWSLEKGISLGNKWVIAGKDSAELNEWLKYFKSLRFSTYLFDSEKELFAWLAQD